MTMLRETILDELLTRVRALSWAGSVIEAGQDEDDAGDNIPNAAVSLASGKARIDVAIGHDTAVGDLDKSGWHNADFVCLVVIGITWDKKTLDPTVRRTTPMRTATHLYGLVQKAVLGDSESTWQLNNLAEKVDCVGGGLLSFLDKEKSTCTTDAVFEITYRHKFNNPEEAV